MACRHTTCVKCYSRRRVTRRSRFSDRGRQPRHRPGGSFAPGEALDIFKPSLMASTMALQLFTASRPHLRRTPLPDLMERPAIWTAASGRASKMIPRTPRGTVTFEWRAVSVGDWLVGRWCKWGKSFVDVSVGWGWGMSFSRCDGADNSEALALYDARGVDGERGFAPAMTMRLLWACC